MMPAFALLLLVGPTPIAGQTEGCTDSAAANYDPGATHADGNCEYTCPALQQALGEGFSAATTSCHIYGRPQPGTWPAA
eukprot:COSAG04_NODE_10576_length_767_cov_1.654192_1_plen_78_part_01